MPTATKCCGALLALVMAMKSHTISCKTYGLHVWLDYYSVCSSFAHLKFIR